MAARAWRRALRVVPVAALAKRTEPLVAVSLADHGARPKHFSPFAPGVARSQRRASNRRKAAGNASA